MRISTSQFNSQSLSGINQHQNTIMQLEEKLTTGKNINRPSDDPSGLNQVHSLNKTMGQLDQYKKNGEFAKGQLNLEETQLQTTVGDLQRARVLSLQMMNGTYNEADRKATAQEVGQIIEHLKNVMNSSNPERELLFAGSNVNEQAAFVADVNNPGYYAYIGSDNATGGARPEANFGARYVQISFDADNRLEADDQGDSSRVRITDNGNKLFTIPDNPDPAENTTFTRGGTTVFPPGLEPDRNILNLMVEFKAYLDEGKTPPGSIASDMDMAIKNISSNLAEIGGRQNRIENQATAGDTFKIALTERRMTIEDTDVVDAISKFTLAKGALQLAQQMFSKVQEMSLFNYIR